jgi:hypothetical protein
MTMSTITTELLAPRAAPHKAKNIATAFLDKILSPYQPTGTDYLRSARVLQILSPDDDAGDKSEPIITTEGRFSIPSSCYIQSTGHFNAVEFLICFNQLAYTTFGHLIAERTLVTLPDDRASSACREQLKRLSLEMYFDKQLSSMFILKTASRFKRVIDASDFQCKLTVDSVFYRHGTLFTNTSCEFSDSRGGNADGTVLLAYPLNLS